MGLVYAQPVKVLLQHFKQVEVWTWTIAAMLERALHRPA